MAGGELGHFKYYFLQSLLTQQQTTQCWSHYSETDFTAWYYIETTSAPATTISNVAKGKNSALPNNVTRKDRKSSALISICMTASKFQHSWFGYDTFVMSVLVVRYQGCFSQRRRHPICLASAPSFESVCVCVTNVAMVLSAMFGSSAARWTLGGSNRGEDVKVLVRCEAMQGGSWTGDAKNVYVDVLELWIVRKERISG